jgi:hypothetical protein
MEMQMVALNIVSYYGGDRGSYSMPFWVLLLCP